MKLKKIFLLIIGAVILVSGTYYTYRWYNGVQKMKAEKAILEKRIRAWNDLKQNLTSEISRFSGTAM